MVNWTVIFNRLMEIVNQPGETYFSGSRFIREIQEVDPYRSSYSEYMEERKKAGKSTTRRYYYKDLLMELDEGARVRVLSSILDEVKRFGPDHSSAIRKLLGGGALAPSASIPAEAWNAARLNEYLREIDGAIASAEFERAVTLSYTCLEGFLGAFVRAKDKRDSYPHELVALSKEVKEYLKKTIEEYPDEVLNGITQAAHAVDRARNRFSESHFASEGRVLACNLCKRSREYAGPVAASFHVTSLRASRERQNGTSPSWAFAKSTKSMICDADRASAYSASSAVAAPDPPPPCPTPSPPLRKP